MITTTAGALSTGTVGALGAKTAQRVNCKDQHTARCEIDLPALIASGGSLPEQIRVHLTAPPAPGMVTVTATVTADGNTHTRQAPVQVKIAGPATGLSISPASGNVLGYDVPDERDQILFQVDAMDTEGLIVETPPLNVTIKDADGNPVAQDQYQTTQSGSLMNILTLDISAAATAALTLGEYTLTATSGALQAERMFTVVGDAASMELELEPIWMTLSSQSVIATATLTDAGGNPVADGTAVTFHAKLERPLFLDQDQDDVRDGTIVLEFRTLREQDSTVLTKGGEASAWMITYWSHSGVVHATTAKADGSSLHKGEMLYVAYNYDKTPPPLHSGFAAW